MIPSWHKFKETILHWTRTCGNCVSLQLEAWPPEVAPVILGCF